jgi:NADPH:quinone reductase-like Zn-dependent oxidoreductase
MKAAVLHGREDIRIERVPVPEALPGELIVRVGAALTCGTDLKVFRRGYHARMIVPPALFGHELAGTVVQAGEGVTDFVSGDRVVALNSVNGDRKTSATICSSTMARMPSSSASPRGLWQKTRCTFRTMCPWSTRRLPSRWHARCTGLRTRGRAPAIPLL